MSDRPDEFSRQIGTLWRSAMVGLDTVREVVIRSSQSGRLRLDIALLRNERAQLLQSLGELTLKHLDEKGFDESTEAMRSTFDRIRYVEARIQSDSARASDNAFGAPRGFEPEAATDYGNDDSIDDPPPENEPEHAPEHAPQHEPQDTAQPEAVPEQKTRKATTKLKDTSR